MAGAAFADGRGSVNPRSGGKGRVHCEGRELGRVTFRQALNAARSVAPGCLAEVSESKLMRLNPYPGTGDLVQRVYAIRVFADFNLAAP